jgi:hypothetical protein
MAAEAASLVAGATTRVVLGPSAGVRFEVDAALSTVAAGSHGGKQRQLNRPAAAPAETERTLRLAPVSERPRRFLFAGGDSPTCGILSPVRATQWQRRRWQVGERRTGRAGRCS